MAPHHEDRERHGSHPLAEWVEAGERSHSDETAERLEMDRATPAPSLIPITWAVVKEFGYVVSVVVMLVSGYYGLKADNSELAHTIEAVAVRVTLIEKDRVVKIPEFDEMKRSNGLQDQRIQNVTEANARTALSVIELGKVVAEQGRVLGEDHTRQAVMEERLGRAAPHDR